MSNDESRHDLPTEGGVIFAENGSETVEEDQTGSTFMDCSINSTDANSLRGTTGCSGQDKSTVGMVGIADYATGSFCSSCSIEPSMPGGLWLDGIGCAMCSYDNGG